MEIFEERLLEIIDDNITNALYRLANLYVNCTVSEREIIRKNWDFNREWEWPGAYKLACKIEGKPDPIIKVRNSLIIDSIADGKDNDYRENLIHMGIIYLSAPYVGLNPDQLFEEIAQISTPKFASALRQFYLRKPEDKSLDAWCLKEEKTKEGVKFISTLTFKRDT
jgi:hypothetical protein